MITSHLGLFCYVTEISPGLNLLNQSQTKYRKILQDQSFCKICIIILFTFFPTGTDQFSIGNFILHLHLELFGVSKLNWVHVYLELNYANSTSPYRLHGTWWQSRLLSIILCTPYGCRNLRHRAHHCLWFWELPPGGAEVWPESSFHQHHHRQISSAKKGTLDILYMYDKLMIHWTELGSQHTTTTLACHFYN